MNTTFANSFSESCWRLDIPDNISTSLVQFLSKVFRYFWKSSLAALRKMPTTWHKVDTLIYCWKNRYQCKKKPEQNYRKNESHLSYRDHFESNPRKNEQKQVAEFARVQPVQKMPNYKREKRTNNNFFKHMSDTKSARKRINSSLNCYPRSSD